MGSGFNPKTRTIDCNGQLITAKLNQVFKTPGTRKYKDAQDNNTFGDIRNVEGNWKDLLIAYLRAGVDVGDEFPAWVAYLEALGAGATGTQGPQSIYDIAQTRYNALTANGGTGIGIDTRTHPHGHVQTSQGLIDSPCPL